MLTRPTLSEKPISCGNQTDATSVPGDEGLARRRQEGTDPDHRVGYLGRSVEVLSRAIREAVSTVEELFGYPTGDGDVNCDS